MDRKSRQGEEGKEQEEEEEEQEEEESADKGERSRCAENLHGLWPGVWWAGGNDNHFNMTNLIEPLRVRVGNLLKSAEPFLREWGGTEDTACVERTCEKTCQWGKERRVWPHGSTSLWQVLPNSFTPVNPLLRLPSPSSSTSLAASQPHPPQKKKGGAPGAENKARQGRHGPLKGFSSAHPRCFLTPRLGSWRTSRQVSGPVGVDTPAGSSSSSSARELSEL